jgi:hypothetical protein
MGRYPDLTTRLVRRRWGTPVPRVRRLHPMALPLDNLGITCTTTTALDPAGVG